MRAKPLYTAAAIIYIAVLAYVFLRWDAIPDPVPMHIGPAGEIDSWAPKTWLSVTAVTLIGLVITVGVAATLPSISLARIGHDQPAGGELPFSETAAKRAEWLQETTNLMLAQVVLGAAALLAVVQIMLIFPDAPISTWSFLILFGAFMVFTLVLAWRLHRTTKESFTRIEPDQEERIRIERLGTKAGMGVYSAPKDPMAVAVLPGEPSKLQINTAHPAGKRALTRIAFSLGGMMIGILVISILA